MVGKKTALIEHFAISYPPLTENATSAVQDDLSCDLADAQKYNPFRVWLRHCIVVQRSVCHLANQPRRRKSTIFGEASPVFSFLVGLLAPNPQKYNL